MTATLRERQRILLVSADTPIREVTSLYLRLAGGYEVLATSSLVEACHRPEDFVPQLLLLHFMRGQRVDPQALSQLDVPGGLPMLCLTGDARPEKAAELHALGASQVLLIPMDPQRVLAFVRALILA